MRSSIIRTILLVATTIILPLEAIALCTLPDCVQILDTNSDGDLTEEFQSAVNNLIYPDGELTTATHVRLEAPPSGSYILSETVRICYDETPPIIGGETVDDCSGVDLNQRFPTIRTSGPWDQVTLRCIIEEERVFPFQAPAYGCIHIGDAFNDATTDDIGPVIPIDLDLQMTMEDSGFLGLGFEGFANSMSAILCDGCSGHIRGHYTIGGPAPSQFTSNAQSLYLVGPDLTISGSFDWDPFSQLQNNTTITFDGDIQSSGITEFMDITGTIVVGSHPLAINGLLNGCKWGEYDQPCQGWRHYPGSILFSRSGYVGALWFTEWDDIHLDGIIDHATRPESLPLVKGHPYDVKSAINFNELTTRFLTTDVVLTSFEGQANGSVYLTGVCKGQGTINPCIRMFNDEKNRDPNYPTQLFLNGLIDRTGLLTDPPEIGNGNITGGFTIAAGGEAIIQPNYRYEGPNYGANVGVNTGLLRGENETSISLSADHESIDPNSLPLCFSRNGGLLRPCNKFVTTLNVQTDSYLAATTLTVTDDVSPYTACDIRWRVAGNCTDCEITEIAEPAIAILDDMNDSTSNSSWSFSGLNASNEVELDRNEQIARELLRLETTASTAAWAEWTPAAPLNLLHEYLLFDIWTDRDKQIDPLVFSHEEFSSNDGFRLRLTDVSGNAAEWQYGAAAGSGLTRLGLGTWTVMLLQHWFEAPTQTTGDFDIEQVAKIRFVFNTVAPEAGRIFQLDQVRTWLREGNPLRYGHETNFGNFKDYRTQQAGDVATLQLSGHFPGSRVLQLEVSQPSEQSCAAGFDCHCDAISATVRSGLIPVNDNGHHFDRVAPGLFEPPVCGIGIEIPFLLWPLYRRLQSRKKARNRN